MKKQIPLLSAVLLVTLLGAVAGANDQAYIFFPESAAIAAGALLSPQFAWKTGYLKMLFLIAAGSVLGLLLTMTPLPVTSQLSLALMLSLGLLLISRTTFVPVIPVTVFPAMLETPTLEYPVAAVLLTAAVIGVRLLLEKYGLLSEHTEETLPKPDLSAVTDAALCWALGSCVLAAAMRLDRNFQGMLPFRFLAAPPLLALTAFPKDTENGSTEKPFRTVGMIGGCAMAGTAMRVVSRFTGCPLFLSVGITVLAVYLMMRETEQYIPQAAALAVIVHLCPGTAKLPLDIYFYPILVTGGACIMTGCAGLRNKLHGLYYVTARKRRSSRIHRR